MISIYCKIQEVTQQHAYELRVSMIQEIRHCLVKFSVAVVQHLSEVSMFPQVVQKTLVR